MSSLEVDQSTQRLVRVLPSSPRSAYVDTDVDGDVDGLVVELRDSTPLHASCIRTASQQRRFFILGSVIALVVSVAQGILLPNPPAIPSPWDRVSACIGWVYFYAWSVSFWPQVRANRHMCIAWCGAASAWCDVGSGGELLRVRAHGRFEQQRETVTFCVRVLNTVPRHRCT